MSFYNPTKWKYVNVKGLGILQGTLCPHYNSMTRGVPRRKHFREMIRKMGGMGIALENNCAIVVVDGKSYRVIRSNTYARAYRVFKSARKVVAEQLWERKELVPLPSLFDKNVRSRSTRP